jgi:hypothetical protein
MPTAAEGLWLKRLVLNPEHVSKCGGLGGS